MKFSFKKAPPLLFLAMTMFVTSCSPTTSEEPTTSTGGVITEQIPSDKQFKKGEQMYDYTFEDIDGVSHNLSEDLVSKELVIINFFASWCGPCVSEFPAMQELYSSYNNQIELYALTVEITDTNDLLKTSFKDRFQATFPIGRETTELFSHFRNASQGSIPVSVFIDRYGTIADIHVGAIPYSSEWVKAVEKYLGDDYVQEDFEDNPDTSNSETTSGPARPDKEMPSSSDIEAVINADNFNFGYYNATGDDAEYNWPWLISDENSAIYPSNSNVDGSYSIINCDFTITNIYDNVLTFDYLTSTENNYDVLYVIVDNVVVTRISGISSEWKTCYAYVPLEEGTYTLSLVYQKDSETSIGDDLVYVRNMRFINVDDIQENMYVKRPAASKYDETTGLYSGYQTLVLNTEDNYYHVNTVDGPLILADLVNVTRWSNQTSPYLLVTENKATINGIDYSKIITDYASYSQHNSTGLTPVTPALKEALVAVTNEYGDNPSDDQWQELCYFYSAYGPTAEEMPSPITGLTMLDPIQGALGNNNIVTFDMIVVPRGKYVSFTPTRTGVYKFNTISGSGTFGSLYNSEYQEIEVSTDYTYSRVINPEGDKNVELYGYLEANKTYYFRVAYSIVEELGSFSVNIEYVGDTYEFLVLASESTAFTTKDEEFDLEDESAIISRNVSTRVDEDGYYRHVRDDGSLGSYIYADFLNPSSMFFLQGKPTSLKTIIENEGAVLEWYDEETLDLIEIEDLTEDFNKYIALAEASTHEYNLIPVNEELAHLLQRLMDYYTFYGVEGSWMKLCFYYDYYGPLGK